MTPFAELVALYLQHHTARELADWCECIPFSVKRWATGVAKPMPGFQKIIIKHIQEIRNREGW